jgi:hypothetical protein
VREMVQVVKMADAILAHYDHGSVIG